MIVFYTTTHTPVYTQCTSFISQYDDDVIDMFVEKEKDIKKQLCHHLTGRCMY